MRQTQKERSLSLAGSRAPGHLCWCRTAGRAQRVRAVLGTHPRVASLTAVALCVTVPGPCDPEDLIDGIIFAANYLGSTQLLSDKTPSKNVRMMQAQEAVSRIKVRGCKGWMPGPEPFTVVSPHLMHLVPSLGECGTGMMHLSTVPNRKKVCRVLMYQTAYLGYS